MRLSLPPAAWPRAGAVLTLIASAACNTSTGDGGSAVGARVRAIQASADAPAVDVAIRDTVRFAALPFDSVTSYVQIPADSDTVVVSNASDQTVLVSTPQVVLAGGIYTLAIFNPAAEMNDIMILDDTTAPASGYAKLRGINLSPSVNVVDVYISPPGTSIDEQSPVMTNLQYPNVSPYVPVLAGTYEIRLTLPATKTVVLDAGTVTFSDGQNRSLVVLDAKGGGTPIGSTILEDRN